jgi:hypothetical protein
MMHNIADCAEAHILELRAPEQTKAISIVLRLVGGKEAVLKAEGVDRLLANEFREQNITDRIIIRDWRNDEEELRCHLGELIGNGSDFSSLIASEKQ